MNESTASLTDSIWNYRNLHGRSYGNSKTTEYWCDMVIDCAGLARDSGTDACLQGPERRAAK